MDFREESFLNGFSEGLDKVAGRKEMGEAVRKGASKVSKFLRGAPGKIKGQWQGTQKGGGKQSFKDIFRGIVGGRGQPTAKGFETGKGARIPIGGKKWMAPGKDVRKGALQLLGKRALIAGAPAAAAGAGGLGLRAALKKKKED